MQGNIFELNHHSKEVNNSLTIVNLFALMIQYEDITVLGSRSTLLQRFKTLLYFRLLRLVMGI